MKTTPQSMSEDFHKFVIVDYKAEATERLKQLWTIVKLCKYVRLRARNNAAFNNLFNQVFPFAKFEQVTKYRPDGSSFPGLKITLRDNPEASIGGLSEDDTNDDNV